MTPPHTPLRLPLNDFYTLALWSGVLSMTALSCLYAALSSEGHTRLVMLGIGTTLGVLSALLLIHRSWLEIDRAQHTLTILRGPGRPLWASRHHDLAEVQRVELLKDAPKNDPAALALEENTPTPATYQTRLVLTSRTYHLPPWEERGPAMAQAKHIAALLKLPLFEGTQQDPFRRSRRWSLLLALANAALVGLYAIYTVAVTPAHPQTIPQTLAPQAELPARTRPLQPEDTCARHDRLWVKRADGWVAAIVLDDQGPDGLHVTLRNDPTRAAHLIPRAAVRLPDAKAAREPIKKQVKSKTYKRNLFNTAPARPPQDKPK